MEAKVFMTRAMAAAGSGAERGPSPAATLVFYDGRCGFCRRQVQRARKWARPGALEFVENGSAEGHSWLQARGLNELSEDMLVVARGERITTKSAAGLQVLKGLRWPYRALGLFSLMPRRWRDAWYDRVAADRERDECEI